MGCGGVVINTVAGVENFSLAANLDFHITPNDNVALLTLVTYQLNGFKLSLGTVSNLHIKGQGDTVTEAGGKTVTNHMVGFFNLLAFTFSGQRIGAELGAVTFQ